MACLHSIEIKQCDWQSHKAVLRAIRGDVFIDEQQVPVELEWDDEDECAAHFLVSLDSQAIGCGRVLDRSSGDEIRRASIGRMAILKPYRHRGYGMDLLKTLVKYCTLQGYEEIVLAAQCHAIGFYQRLGFKAEGDIFMDAGIEHRTMRLKLSNIE